MSTSIFQYFDPPPAVDFVPIIELAHRLGVEIEQVPHSATVVVRPRYPVPLPERIIACGGENDYALGLALIHAIAWTLPYCERHPYAPNPYGHHPFHPGPPNIQPLPAKYRPPHGGFPQN